MVNFSKQVHELLPILKILDGKQLSRVKAEVKRKGQAWWKKQNRQQTKNMERPVKKESKNPKQKRKSMILDEHLGNHLDQNQGTTGKSEFETGKDFISLNTKGRKRKRETKKKIEEKAEMKTKPKKTPKKLKKQSEEKTEENKETQKPREAVNFRSEELNFGTRWSITMVVCFICKCWISIYTHESVMKDHYASPEITNHDHTNAESIYHYL